MKIRRNLFLFLFLLLLPVTQASEIRVLYFYNTPCSMSQQMQPYKDLVKSYWQGKVAWLEYDFSSIENKSAFTDYRIVNVPVAIVECFEASHRIERDDIQDELNKTIYDCYTKCGNATVEQRNCGPPGYIENRTCGLCGNQRRVCGDNCAWSTWNECASEGVCSTGEIQNRSCVTLDGCIGVENRICSNCQWQPWGECVKLDPRCVKGITIVSLEEGYERFFVILGVCGIILSFAAIRFFRVKRASKQY